MRRPLIPSQLPRIWVPIPLARLSFIKGKYGYILRMVQTNQLVESNAQQDQDEYCIERIGRYQVSGGKESLISMNLSPIKRRWFGNVSQWSSVCFGYLHLLHRLLHFLLLIRRHRLSLLFLLARSSQVLLLLVQQLLSWLQTNYLSITDRPKSLNTYFPSSLRVKRPRLFINSYFSRQIGFSIWFNF